MGKHRYLGLPVLLPTKLIRDLEDKGAGRVAPCEVGQSRGRAGDGSKRAVAKVNTEAKLYLNFR